ncbi:MAG: DUF3794 domain-containing protein [Clostridia bacterium]|nr:DUF3794 domain-containing protein [Clostridia bacterium]
MQENSIVSIKTLIHDAVDFNNEYTLPDYIVDVRKLIRCDGKAVLHNVYVNGDSITFEGEVTYSILVICEDDSIRNLIYSEEFMLNGNNTDGCLVFVHECKLEGLTARLVSPRKLNCRCKAVVYSKNNITESVSTEYTGIDMPGAEHTTERKLSECSYLTISESCIQNQHASRDIELPSDRKEISTIVYCKVNVQINERKIVEDKLFLRGETVTEILYEATQGEYVKYYDRSPFSEVIENSNDSSAHICEVYVTDVKASVRNNSFGEMRLIELDYTYGIKCRYYIERKTDVLTDVYSVEYDVKCETGSVSALKLNSIFSGSLSFNETCDIEEQFDEVIDCCATVISTNIGVDPIGKKVIVTGDIKFDIVYKKEEHGCFSVIKPFKYEREYDGTDSEVYTEYFVTVQTAMCNIEKDKLLINAEIFFNIMIAQCCEYEFKENVCFLKSNDNNKCPVIIYYPAEGDTLWEIAKMYKSTCKDIISVNSLTSESLEGVKVLLLPKKRKKSVFNAIL